MTRRPHLQAPPGSRGGPRLALLCCLLIGLQCSRAFDLNLLPEEQEEADLHRLPGEGDAMAASSGRQAATAARIDLNHADEPPATLAPLTTTLAPTTTTTLTTTTLQTSGKRGLWDNVKRFTGAALGPATSGGQLPQYFNYEQFSQKFRHHYTAAEKLFRKSMFLRRCMEVFRGRVAFRLGRKSYLESVNKYADRSPNEIKRMFMSGPPIEFRPAHQSEQEYYRELERVSRERSKWDAELTSQAPAGSGGGDEEEAADLASSGDNETILHESQARRRIEAMIKSQSVEDEVKLAILEELRGAAGDAQGFSQSASGQLPLKRRALPWPGGSPVSDTIAVPLLQQSAAYEPPQVAPDDAMDWSEHQCFHKIYDQGVKCGKCYVMAATTLAEFYKCSERLNVINRRQFSKDYVLDCGQKFAPTILGCVGGSLLDTLSFIAQAGMHNIKGWRSVRDTKYKELARSGLVTGELDQRCPLNKMETPVREWGEIRVGVKPVPVAASQWLEAVQVGPLAVSVQMPAVGIEGYAGGVHDGTGCATSGHWHSMVLVGYGVSERGLAYWRFRNSWGADWGDKGHFNMAMSVPGECLAGGVRLFRTRDTPA